MYVGNSLYCIGKGLGCGLSKQYSDIVKGTNEEKQDKMTGDEVVAKVVKNAGLKVVSK